MPIIVTLTLVILSALGLFYVLLILGWLVRAIRSG